MSDKEYPDRFIDALNYDAAINEIDKALYVAHLQSQLTAALALVDSLRPVNQEMLEALKRCADFCFAEEIEKTKIASEAAKAWIPIKRAARQAILSAESGRGE